MKQEARESIHVLGFEGQTFELGWLKNIRTREQSSCYIRRSKVVSLSPTFNTGERAKFAFQRPEPGQETEYLLFSFSANPEGSLTSMTDLGTYLLRLKMLGHL